jgi:4-amino-4-deoxy-L-arabinose transferase-like glycosyltransferase
MFYLQALLFAIFGKTIVPQAIFHILVHGVISALIFSLAYRLGAARVPALILAGLYMVQHWGLAIEISHFMPALALILFALERIYRYVCGGDARRLLIQTGIALGFAAWFKHDVAAYFAIGAALGLTISWYALPNRPDNWLSPFTASLWLASASFAIAFPMVVWLAVQAGPDAWIDLIVYPATEFRDVRGEGLPSLRPLVENISAWLSAPTQLKETRELVLTIGLWILFYMPVALLHLGR